MRLAVVKRAGAYQPIDLARREPAYFERRARPFEKFARRRDGHFVARADRDDAGHELFERGIEAVIRQLEHRGPGERAHRHPDTTNDLVNVERPFRCGHGAPAPRRRLSFSTDLKRSPLFSIVFRIFHACAWIEVEG